jgi:O-antigen/teichoic acid export membrane protein
MSIYGSRQARRALLDTALFRSLSQLTTVISFIVLARAMPDEDFGVFNLLYAFIPVLSTVASLGLEQTLQRYQPEYLSAGDIPSARWLVRFVASARFGANVALLALIFLTWNHVAPIFKLTPYRGEFAFFCLLVLLYFQANILQISLAANMLHRFSVGSIMLMSTLKLVAYAGLAWFDSLNLTTAIFSDTFAGAIAYLFLLRAYRRHCPAPPQGHSGKPNSNERKRLFRYGLLNNFNEAGAWVLSSKSDTFFIAAFLDPVAVGVYAFYTRLNQMVAQLQPVSLFQNVIQPLFFAVPQSEADIAIPRHFSLLLNTSLLLQWPALAYSLVYHKELVTFVFGGKFADFSGLLPLIVAFGTLQVIARPVTLVAQYEEKAGVMLLSKIFALYNVLALVVLIPVAGLYGAVIATGSATLFKNLFVWWHVRQRARWVNFAVTTLSSILIWGGAVITCLLLKTWLDIPVWGQLIIGLVICGTTLLAHVRTIGLSESDRKTLASVLRGREKRLLQVAGVIRRA